MLHGHRDNHGRELRALRLVDGHRVGQRDFIQFTVVVRHQPVVEPYRDFLLDGIDLLDHADVTIEDFFFVVVLRLDDLVPDLEPPAESLRGGFTETNGIQSTLEHRVQLTDADRAPVHRAQNLYVADWFEVMPFRDSVLHQLHQCRGDFLRRIALDEIEVRARLRRPQLRHLPLTNQVSVGDDFAACRLPEYFSQTNDGYHAAFDQVA